MGREKPKERNNDDVQQNTNKGEHSRTMSTIILLHKKGKRYDLNNYRPISLISNLYKVFMKVITNRLTTTMDENQPSEQAGFRAGYSMIDHLQAVREIIEKCQEFNINLYIAFIDYKKLFDSIEHFKVLEALRIMSINSKYIRVVGKIYLDGRAKVKTEQEGAMFRVKRGVKQGDPISRKTFHKHIGNDFYRKPTWEKKKYGININGKRLTNLCFADDVVFAKSAKELETMLTELNT